MFLVHYTAWSPKLVLSRPVIHLFLTSAWRSWNEWVEASRLVPASDVPASQLKELLQMQTLPARKEAKARHAKRVDSSDSLLLRV